MDKRSIMSINDTPLHGTRRAFVAWNVVAANPDLLIPPSVLSVPLWLNCIVPGLIFRLVQATFQKFAVRTSKRSSQPISGRLSSV
jgi:hypothetical protein